MNIDVTRESVLLSGKSYVNQALQPCPVTRKFAYFTRLALAVSQDTLKRPRGFVCDAHRVSDRVEKLAQPTAAKAIV